MTAEPRSVIRKLATGVPGLDEVLGGGLPEYSFNLIAGDPGAGKTTLAQQIAFANAMPARPAIYFTVLGEPPLKMLRYQQQYSFFDPLKIDSSIRFVNLSEEVLQSDLGKVLDRIIGEVEKTEPAIVVVDSFRTIAHYRPADRVPVRDLLVFVQRLALHLTSWQVTSFLVGEYADIHGEDAPVFTIADGILWLSQERDRNSIVRKVQVVKLRGQAPMPGLHTFRITGNGVEAFPRISLGIPAAELPARRLSTGITELDEMMGGGIPAGDSVLIAGPSGSGKSVLAAQFITEGVKQGEPGVLVVFEEHPNKYLRRAEGLGLGIREMVEQGKVAMIYLRPPDLSPDETLHEIREAVKKVGAKRVVIDSLSGFELALAPAFGAEFRESLYRLIGSLTGEGITVLTTMELAQSENQLSFTPNVVSFLADDLLVLRYVEIEKRLTKVLAVAKMRGSQHSKDFREYEINAGGLKLLDGLEGYTGRISGAPQLLRTKE
jgi:circadian clock protein KaiC